MAQASGYILASNVNASADQAAQVITAGRYVLCLVASAYGTTVKLQVMGPDAATWIDINGTTYSVNQVIAYDLPSGLVRMHIASGTTTALYASLVRVPY